LIPQDDRAVLAVDRGLGANDPWRQIVGVAADRWGKTSLARAFTILNLQGGELKRFTVRVAL